MGRCSRSMSPGHRQSDRFPVRPDSPDADSLGSITPIYCTQRRVHAFASIQNTQH